jgi:hypothetical protein
MAHRVFAGCSLLLVLIGCSKTYTFSVHELREAVQAGRVLRAHLESGYAVRGVLRDGSSFVCELPSRADWPSMAVMMRDHNVDLVFLSDSQEPPSEGAWWGLVRSVR